MQTKPTTLWRLRRPLLGLAVALISAAAWAQASGPYQYYPILPCRAYDSRFVGSPPAPSPVHAGEERALRIKDPGACGVPVDAKAVSVNLTVTEPTTCGDLRVAPTGSIPFPNVSTLNYGLPPQTVANGAIVPLGETPDTQTNDLRVLGAMCDPAGQYHVIVDVTGYFRRAPRTTAGAQIEGAAPVEGAAERY